MMTTALSPKMMFLWMLNGSSRVFSLRFGYFILLLIKVNFIEKLIFNIALWATISQVNGIKLSWLNSIMKHFFIRHWDIKKLLETTVNKRYSHIQKRYQSTALSKCSTL